MRRLAWFVCVALAAFRFPLFPQEAFQPEDFFSLLGMELGELIGRFGPPEAVFPVRGDEEWQDDVVFVYSEGDFYISKDRVWQVAFKSLQGLKLGDPKPAALLVMGDETRDEGDYALAPFPGGGWPRMLRVNFNSAGLISAIFIYRSDF